MSFTLGFQKVTVLCLSEHKVIKLLVNRLDLDKGRLGVTFYF